MEGAHHLDLKSFGQTTPSITEFESILRKLGIGKETNVVCYDSADGIWAVRGACLLSALGIKTVRILDCKFNTHFARKEAPMDAPKPHTGKDFAF